MPVPDFSPGEVLTAAAMDSIGLWACPPTSVAGTGVTQTGFGCSFTGTTSASVNGVFSSNFRRYRVEINHSFSTTGQVLYFRLRSGGVDAITNNYSYIVSYRGYSSAVVGFFNGSSLSTSVIGYGDPATTGTVSFDIDAPFLAHRTNINGGCAWAGAAAWEGSQHLLANSYDGMTIFIVSGGTMAGSINVYGYKD